MTPFTTAYSAIITYWLFLSSWVACLQKWIYRWYESLIPVFLTLHFNFASFNTIKRVRITGFQTKLRSKITALSWLDQSLIRNQLLLWCLSELNLVVIPLWWGNNDHQYIKALYLARDDGRHPFNAKALLVTLRYSFWKVGVLQAEIR